jgi:hypothetical protein
MAMREDLQVSEKDDRVLNLSGQESVPRLTADQVVARREDLLSCVGQIFPVVFTTKTYLNGFYLLQDAGGDLTDWDYSQRIFAWQCSLQRLGTEYEVDIESRLSGAQSRANNFSVVGERTHAPAIGHNAYWSDATTSTAVSRPAEDGTIKAYRNLGLNVSPRWAISPISYGGGRVRILVSGQERAGSQFKFAANTWELANSLVRVRPLSSGGALEIAAYTGGSWRTKNWDITSAAVSLAPFDYAAVLDNRYESATIRLTKSGVIGRTYVDLTLRRGFRFVEIVVQAEFGATLKVVRATNEAGTNSLGGTVVAAANDADGNKYIVGSARTFTADITAGGLSIASTALLDAFVGVVAGGTGAVTGDTAADLQKQYVGAPSELIQAVRR